MTTPPPHCPVVLRRIHFDKKNGRTTSKATIDFLQRICSCDACSTARRAAKKKL